LSPSKTDNCEPSVLRLNRGVRRAQEGAGCGDESRVVDVLRVPRRSPGSRGRSAPGKRPARRRKGAARRTPRSHLCCRLRPSN
jgi:hypothetical protein